MENKITIEEKKNITYLNNIYFYIITGIIKHGENLKTEAQKGQTRAAKDR